MATRDLAPFLDRVTEIAPTTIYVYNQVKNRNEYSNRNIGSVLGYSISEIQEMGRNLMAQCLHPDDRPDVFAHFGSIRELDDGAVASVEYRMRHKNGKWIWLLSNDTVFQRDPSGAVTHHIGAAVDITAQKHAEAEALRAQAKAATVNDELRNFAYAISHDIKAPTNTLHLVLEELRDAGRSRRSPDEEDLLDLAQLTVTRMSALIDDVLQYTKIIGQEMQMDAVDLADLVAELHQTLHCDIKVNKATIRVGDLPRVRGSQMQLLILLQNLMQNALKFARPGVPPQVYVGAEAGRDPTRVKVIVSDNGIGIPPDKKEQIFHVFKRLNASETKDGNGIGLATCRRIAGNHNTEIQVISSVGEGATFSFELERA